MRNVRWLCVCMCVHVYVCCVYILVWKLNARTCANRAKLAAVFFVRERALGSLVECTCGYYFSLKVIFVSAFLFSSRRRARSRSYDYVVFKMHICVHIDIVWCVRTHRIFFLSQVFAHAARSDLNVHI